MSQDLVASLTIVWLVDRLMMIDVVVNVNDSSFCNSRFFISHNVFYHYLNHDHYLISFQTLIFTFSPRRRRRRRQQYEIIQKMLYETSLNIANIYLLIISIQNSQMFQFIDNHHSTFTFWSHSQRKSNHSRKNSSEISSIDKYNLSLMMQSCRLRFSSSEESTARFQTQFLSKTLKLKSFEVDDDKVSSISMSFSIL